MSLSDKVRPLTIDPGRQFGRICIGGTRVPAKVIAESVWAGDSVDSVADDYDVERLDVLVACWWYVDHGNLRWARGAKRAQWVAWADRALEVLGGWDKTDVLCDPDDYIPAEAP